MPVIKHYIRIPMYYTCVMIILSTFTTIGPNNPSGSKIFPIKLRICRFNTAILFFYIFLLQEFSRQADGPLDPCSPLINFISGFAKHAILYLIFIIPLIVNRFSIFFIKKIDIQYTSKNEMANLYMRASYRISTATTMGFQDKEYNSDLFKEYISTLHIFLEYLVQRLRKLWLHSDYLFKWSSLKRQQDKTLNRMNKLSNQIISKKEIEMQNNMNAKFKVYIELLIELKLKNVLTNKEVKEEADTLIAAGYDTTSLTVAQILIILGSYPEVQEKVYKELQEIFLGGDRDVLKQDLSQMKYLEAVIKESMRLYPVVPMIVRHIDKTLNIKDYILPAGDDFMIPIYALNRHSVWGPDAEVFRPERWLNSNTLPEKAYSFASFSIGRRNCIGMNYAMMSMKTALVHVLRQFKINADIKKIKYEFLVTLVPVSGYHITVEKR
ncbi:hypothetical protein K1T71_013605 [Dendrolimus kikuchii]|uniref:Uncharacterized protein n=1 Tax=Dendrolimus kikuchii TaxID=765133 RepID=A0ACC1CH40_9NEOP|nr:hypothetical protein K1T71_013605 [Dendrolimus kikuchii]